MTSNPSRLAANVPIHHRHHPLWSEGFRPFFLILPIYAIISIVLWGLIWGGVIPIRFSGQLLYWHIYEMLFGLGLTGMLGFLLTAIPSFITGTSRVQGYKLAGLLGLWLLGRLSFWLFSFTGMWLNMLLHLTLSTLLLAWLAKPIWTQTGRPQLGLWLSVLLLTLLQGLFFLSQSETALGGLPEALRQLSPMQWLYAAVSGWMILIVLVLRRVSMGVTNTLLDQYGVEQRLIARPPIFNLAVFCLLLYLMAELIAPNQALLGWLAFAVGCSLLNLLNDFFKLPFYVLFWHHVRYLCLIIILMAMGYFAIGWDHLHPDVMVLNHLRHILTTGVIGLSYILVLSIVAVRHTGRLLRPSLSVDIMVALIILAVSLRLAIMPYPNLAAPLYMWSALVWALAFLLYLVRYGRYLISRNTA